MLRTNEDKNAVSILLPAGSYLIVFFLCHTAIHAEERCRAIRKFVFFLIPHRMEGVSY